MRLCLLTEAERRHMHLRPVKHLIVRHHPDWEERGERLGKLLPVAPLLRNQPCCFT